MRNRNTLKLFLTLLPLFLYGAFFLWYTNLQGPLTEKEITEISGKMREAGHGPDDAARMIKFMRRDTGREFFMLNASTLRERPLRVGDVKAGETSAKTMSRYTAFMVPTLFRRACMPIFSGSAVSGLREAIGGDAWSGWGQGALVRYRSRRDLIEIIMSPDFQKHYKYKAAALSKSMAFPIEPTVGMFSPRIFLGLVTIIAILLVRLFMR